ncbi:helix-turn-helix domain-containing protein [Phascolarctobacterium succinatutens]|uniref:helix-turn-helix domain-containing protein n=1 Tax=Phascolarctobacterium succinatutens TaxID=626940 RepID=UPI0023F17ADC|nr:helix-turn-helix transcriptional regulator [Phascolarctobacterium succinatutens]
MNKQQMLGELIKKARTEQKLSQGQLAKILEVQNPIIYKYEKGLIKTIPFEKRVKLSEALKIPITNLLYENEKKVGLSAITDKTWDVLFSFSDAIIGQSKEKALAFLLEQVKGKTLAGAISDTALATYIAESADEQYKGIMMQGLQGLLIDRGINQENAAQLAAILQELLSLKFSRDITISEKIAAAQKENK